MRDAVRGAAGAAGHRARAPSSGRLSRPDDPARAGAAPDLADRRRRRCSRGSPASTWSTISAPPTSRPAGRARRSCRSIHARAGGGARAAARRAQYRRRRQCHLDRRGGRRAVTLLAFDTGPGNALLDDWTLRHTGRPADIDGALAAAGESMPALAGAAAPSLFRAAGAEIARPQCISIRRRSNASRPPTARRPWSPSPSRAVARARRLFPGAGQALAGHRRRPAQPGHHGRARLNGRHAGRAGRGGRLGRRRARGAGLRLSRRALAARPAAQPAERRPACSRPLTGGKRHPAPGR